MKSILNALFDGEIYPSEQYVPRTQEFLKAHWEQLKRYEDFTDTLSKIDPALGKQFQQIMEEEMKTLSFEVSQMFIDSFCLGARMMMEIFQNPVITQERDE